MQVSQRRTAQSLTLQSLEHPLGNSSIMLLRGRGPIVRALPLLTPRQFKVFSKIILKRNPLNTITAVNSLGTHTKFLSLKVECLVNLNSSLNFPQRLGGCALAFQTPFLENIPRVPPLLFTASFNFYHDALVCSYL